MNNINLILLKLEAKSQLYEEDVFLGERMLYITGQHFKTLSQAGSHLLQDPQAALGLVLENAFTSQRGQPYRKIAVDALKRASRNNFTDFIRESDAPDRVWAEFKDICRQKGWGDYPRETPRKLIRDLLDFARDKDNIVAYLRNQISKNLLKESFTELNEIHGIGDKVAAFILRDITWLCDLESQVPMESKVYLQPIDAWVRRFANCLWKQLDNSKVLDCERAKRIADACEKHGISGIRFNQGAWYFGAKEVKDRRKLCERLWQMGGEHGS